jgi:multidrug efflux pump subunit AcrA (membrane-fusion protein)
MFQLIFSRPSKCLLSVAGAAFLLSGCAKPNKSAPSVAEPPTVRIVSPETRTITRVVGQPSFVESYERTSMYSKVMGFVEKWNVDIGDKVKKDQVLATIYAPEVNEDWETKKNTVKLDKERVTLAEKLVEVGKADVQAADANLLAAKNILGQYEAQVVRWDSEVKRLTKEVKSGVVDAQVLLESQNQLKANTAQRDAAKATIAKAEAELLSKKATLAQELVDVEVAKARVAVSESEARKQAVWVSYLKVTAPFDGVIVARSTNTGDFSTPLTGDPSADARAPHLSPSGRAAPLYVVDRTDVVRIFVDVPEADANYVHGESTVGKGDGSKAMVRVTAFRDVVIPATVTRTAWALNVKSRTLRAEIDLRNEDLKMYFDKGDHAIAEGKQMPRRTILPGMYAYGKVKIERPKVQALPMAALMRVGDKAYYWRLENGKAVRIEVQTGLSDGEWIEVTSREIPGKEDDTRWAKLENNEQIIIGDLSVLTDGGLVQVSSSKSEVARTGEGKSGSD